MLSISMIAATTVLMCVFVSLVILVADSLHPIEEAQAVYFMASFVASLTCLCAKICCRQDRDLHDLFLLGLIFFGLIALAIGNQFTYTYRSQTSKSETTDAGAPATESGPVS